MSYLLKQTLLAILLTLVPVAVFGQAISGDLVGAVRDSSGAVVPNATVEATNLGTAYKTSRHNHCTWRISLYQPACRPLCAADHIRQP
jgi:hypothetical protein